MTVRTGSIEMNEGNKQILIAVTNLNSLSQEIGQAIEETNIGINEINSAITNISSLSETNRGNIKIVEEESSKFKTI